MLTHENVDITDITNQNGEWFMTSDNFRLAFPGALPSHIDPQREY